MSTCVYSYGAKPPVAGAAEVAAQLEIAARLQNALVACARRLRDMEDRIVAAAIPAHLHEAEAAALAVLQGAQREAANGRSGGGKRRGASPMAPAVAAARAAYQDARRARWGAAREARPGVRHSLDEARSAARDATAALVTEARAAGLSLGSAELVTDAVEQATKRAENGRPNFHPLRRPRAPATATNPVPGPGGRIGVRWRDGVGMAVEDAVRGGDATLRIDMVARDEWDARRGKPAPAGQTGDKPRAIVRMSIGRQGAPAHVEIPITLHRPLPPGARIKRAWILAREVGHRTEWSVQFTLALDIPPAPPAAARKVAVNLGWRWISDQWIRVGYVVGSDGYREEIRVPERIGPMAEKCASLRSIRDVARNGAIETLLAYAARHDAPAGLRRALEYARQWRSGERLIDLRARWSSTTSEPERAIVAMLDGWIAQDRHLRTWECDQWAKMERHRQHAYREIAARLANRYDELMVTEMDLRQWSVAPAPEEGAASEGRDMRWRKARAAPSVLRAALLNAFRMRGKAADEAPAMLYTRTCPACGVVAPDDDPQFAASVTVRCGACGAARDQDEAHAARLVADGSARAVAEVAAAGGAGRYVGRWERRRSKTAEKAP